MKARATTLLEYHERGEFARWGLAAAAVLAGHAALAGGYLLLRNADRNGMLSAPVVIVDLAPLPVAPASAIDIAAGPQMQEAQPEPFPQREPEIKPPPQPENRAVAELEQKPKAEPKPAKKPPAPRTAAAPRSPVHTGAVAAAPATGGDSSNILPPSWVSQLFSHLLRYRQYPSLAQSGRQEGVVTLNFTLDRHGRVVSRHIAHSSGVAVLDAEALAMIERAQPLPPFPPAMGERARNFSAPIKFSLR